MSDGLVVTPSMRPVLKCFVMTSVSAVSRKIFISLDKPLLYYTSFWMLLSIIVGSPSL